MDLDRQPLKPGSIIANRYELEERLAKGGFAIVWKAHDRLLGKSVALKLLHDAFADDEASVNDLKRETLRTRELSHENIVQTYDFVQDGSIVGISMEFIDGKTLSALVSRTRNRVFNPSDIAPWIAPICEALDYAHAERGSKKTVVHHDLKPGNVMVDGHDHVKVLDFGISKTITETHLQVTGQFAVAGTPPYMSPQQMKGSRPRPADDIYSLGALIYALLTGKPPFHSGDMRVQINEVIPPSMNERRTELGITDEPAIPEEWEEIVAQCLAKEPADRPQSVREIAERLGLREPSSRRLTPSAGTPLPGAQPGATLRLDAATQVSSEPSDSPRRKPPVAWFGVGGALALGFLVYWFGFRGGDGAPDPMTATTSPPPVAALETPTKPAVETTVAPTPAPPTETVPSNPVTTKPTPTKPVDPNRERIASLRSEIAQDLSADRWAEASDKVRELLSLAPGDPEAVRWRDRANLEMARHAEIAELKTAIPQAIQSRQWDTASKLVSKLRAHAPNDTDAARWGREIASAASNDSRTAALRETIPAALAAGRWDVASRDVEELLRLAPGDRQAADWRDQASAQTEVRALVNRYETSLESLDASGYRACWVDLPDAQFTLIQRSFQDMNSQDVTIDQVAIAIDGDRATARVHETRVFHLKAGGRHTQDTNTVLTLLKTGAGWKISSRKAG